MRCGQESFEFEVSSELYGRRLDAAVAASIEGCSRSYASSLIRKGNILVNQTSKKPGYILKPGEIVSVTIPPPEPVDYLPEKIDLEILYEDKCLAVINKAPGMVVHPAPGHSTGTIVNALLYRFPDLEGIGGEARPGIVHRLDKDTSGILVIAKTHSAHLALSAAFKSRRIKKKYLALVYGETKDDFGEITLPVGRHPADRKKMSVRSRSGRSAETHWRVLKRFKGFTLLEVDLKTGRTHQIRVHMKAIGHSIVGDPVYCFRKSVLSRPEYKPLKGVLSKIERQMLHAFTIEFTHPENGNIIAVEASMPPDMQELLRVLEKQENAV